MIKSKSKNFILGILLCICAAFFACGIFAISNTKDKGQTVTAEAATAITPTIYWRYTSSSTTLELSSSQLTGGTATGSFNSDTAFATNTDQPWTAYSADITKVNILNKIAPVSTENWFRAFGKLQEVENIGNLDTSNVVNMRGVFCGCEVLIQVDVSGFDTSNVTNMGQMFQSCMTLTNINVSGFDTSNVTNMSGMFSNCWALTEIDVSNFDTSQVSSVQSMFSDTTSLNKVKLSDNLAKKIASLSNSGLKFPFYYQDGTVCNTASQMNKGGGYFKTMHYHTYDTAPSSVDEATCSTTGTKYYDCQESFCTDVKTETIPANGQHSFTNYVSNNNATCTADGTKTATCDNCTATETITDTGTATGHSTTYNQANAPTCVTPGNVEYYYCSKCNKNFDDSVGTNELTTIVDPATGVHSFTTYTSDGNATCFADGTKTAHCDTNGCTATDIVTDTGTMKPHSFTKYVSDGDATCTADGHETATCDSCHSATDKRVEVDSALGHDFSITVSGTQPTCQQGGSAVMQCSRCTETETQTSSSPVGHKYTNYVSNNDATCTADGTKTAHCDFDCGTDDTIADVGSATGHTPGTAATCTEPQTCDICGTELAAALGHTEVTDEAKAPACTETGLTEGKHCSVCDTVITAQEEVPALGHNYEWVITKEPTVDETGLKENICTVCGDKDGEEELAKLVVDENGSVGDLPAGNVYDLEIAVKESDSLYNIPGITRGYKVELFVVEGEDRNPYDNSKTVTLMLVIPEGMEDEFTLYCRHGEILERVDPASYTVNGKSVTIRTTLPNEYVFNAPAPEEPSSGIPWWVWLLVILGSATLLAIIIVIIVVAKKKKGDNTPTDNGELLQRLDNQDQVLNELFNRGDDGGFNTPVELDENGNVIFK